MSIFLLILCFSAILSRKGSAKIVLEFTFANGEKKKGKYFLDRGTWSAVALAATIGATDHIVYKSLVKKKGCLLAKAPRYEKEFGVIL